MIFSNELEFEKNLIDILLTKGWEKEVLKNKNEKDLIQNWSNILFENNRSIDRLGDYPLTSTEMEQILNQINTLKTPLKLNSFINGKTVIIKRDNINDKLNYGREVSLKIYDRQEIAAGQSRYQIVEQPILTKNHELMHDRRGDLMLLINGMPLIHIELKRNNIPVSQAYNQIEKYSKEGVFSGLFSLIQVFVAMTPEETVYFANPGPEGIFRKEFYFHWADFNNEPINKWNEVATTLLSIPMAHQLIGFYTVADETDGVLKVMRSYQYFAANRISDKVAGNKWDEENIYGGYIWHTTGSGKTMTSFKSAQLIANSKDADKVIFLMDRIELGTQSLLEYRGFADETDSIQATENTYDLISKLKSTDIKDTLIVTSIQKMSNIKEDSAYNKKDIEKINSKRIVFIIDECHRSTFGTMLQDIKATFPRALYFGFTGTPIHEENQKHYVTTKEIFGDELHRYSIADGIRDKNVLGFDPYIVDTFTQKEIRHAVALDMAKAKDMDDIYNNPAKKEIYFKYMDATQVPYVSENGTKGIEDYIPTIQYEDLSKGENSHKYKVCSDIINNWFSISKSFKFSAILATSSIKEAIEYYHIFKEKLNDENLFKKLNLTCLFDPSIDNNGGSFEKEKAMIEILEDYNKTFNVQFTIPMWDKYKKDVSLRLSHKKPYFTIDKTPELQLDLLIVVDQMLTGFDSKWLNALYLDKLLEYENIVQSFSRTNRVFGIDKNFGIIKYYRKPHTMQKRVEKAFNLYSGNKPFGIFVDKLPKNIEMINQCFLNIKDLFESDGIENFQRNPSSNDECQKFILEFRKLRMYIESAKAQCFKWNRTSYTFKDNNDNSYTIDVLITKDIYDLLKIRYNELYKKAIAFIDNVPFDIDYSINELDSGKINYDYLNERFRKYFKRLQINSEEKDIVEKALSDLQNAFAYLSQEDQKYANIIIHDIQSGDLIIEDDKKFTDYIVEYKKRNTEDLIKKFSIKIGIDEQKLRDFIKLNKNEQNLNEFGMFDDLKKHVDLSIANKYFEAKEQKKISNRNLSIKLDNLLRDFIVKGPFEI